MIQYCTRCVTPSTRPRLTFNEDGLCSACQHHDRKVSEIDWSARWEQLAWLCNRYRKDSGWDCIIPCSGGKDGSYVAHRMKYDLGMHPLCITFAPQIQTHIGRQNLENFKALGYDHIMLSPDPLLYRELAVRGFVEQGQPKMPFVAGISLAIFRYALAFDIPFIMYGEEGEAEYGGATDAEQRITKDYLLKYYYDFGYERVKRVGTWWELPSGRSEGDYDKLYPTHFSKFAFWDPEAHARFAAKHCGLQMLVGGSIGTFTNYAQLDDVMQDLHTHLMFCKFGFGRATSDASIEVRMGRMTREEAVKVVNLVDGQFPLEYLPAYLDYFQMADREFWRIIARWVNPHVLHYTGRAERPYELKEAVR